jgi:hypothetical protein
MTSKKLDTRLESEGAEFLVLGQLLINKIPTYKTYTNMPGYDLVATNPENNKSAKIQVKSRWKTGARGFIIKKFDCDFVVIVLLNRGSKDGAKKASEPLYYVLPVSAVNKLPKDTFDLIAFKSVINFESYNNNWAQIAEFLKL